MSKHKQSGEAGSLRKPAGEKQQAKASQEPLSLSNRAHPRTEQNQPMDAGPDTKERKVGQHNAQGRPPLMKK